jgi:hypothetical protein
VSNKITHSVESLQRVLYDLDTKTRHSEERLSELSITVISCPLFEAEKLRKNLLQADTTIALTLDSARGVLRSLARSVALSGQEAKLSLDSDPPGLHSA